MKNCKQCNVGFEVTDQDRKFYEMVSPEFNGKKYLIPEPTLCPDCRQQRRLSFCNERHLYSGECGMCKKRTLTEQPPHNNQPIYCRECWHSDKWNPIDYGRDFDFSRPFFEQLLELKKSVPTLALNTQGTIQNSEYIHYAGSCKNCYLIMHADFCEDCYYGYGFKKNIFCVDGFYNLQCELCYDSIYVHKSYGLKGCQDCINCHSSAFLRDCIGCKNCFLCVGLREKEYCYKNEQLSKEEYEKHMSEIDLGDYSQYQKYKDERREIEKNVPFKEFQGHNLQNCSGNYLNNCKDVHSSFDCEDVENGKYLYQVVTGAKNVYDIYQYGLNLQQSYECTISGENSYHLLFCDNCHVSSADLIYCWYMERSKNCFGCVNMQQKTYCILNKQYSKEEYEGLVSKIIEHMQSTGEWGNFFSSSISLFGYNKTSAQMYYPLEKEEALIKGFKWDDYEPPLPKVDKTIPANRLPDNIKDIPDDILDWAIVCEVTGKPFRIISQELKFYRDQNLPIPRRSPDQRHLDRFHRRNPRHLYGGKCDSCQKIIQTTYSPDRQEKVYCEDCYLKEAY
ncbi:hypothetical protein KJ742_05080 [Patescibacteria group bacterium]|nr:hypothetical protein [Patescibacteria group bacterium]MBU1683292.1 hypothetical protein [Patescibacteria group bacterium]MBU1935308.1 hypothetical protein [Patescibacteria group bacterium]